MINPEPFTVEGIVKAVMAGETISLPTMQFGQFLWACEVSRLEFCIKTKQQGSVVVLERWDLGRPEGTLH